MANATYSKSVKVKVTTDPTIPEKEVKKGKKQRTNTARSRIQREIDKANKRLKRLEERGMTNAPAYKSVTNGGNNRFSIKGKNESQMYNELNRVKSFLNHATSTIKGCDEVAKSLAKTVDFNTKGLSKAELRITMSKFMSLADKTNTYLENAGNVNIAIGYRRVWDVVKKVIQDKQINLASYKGDIDSLANTISQMIDSEPYYEEHDRILGTNKMLKQAKIEVFEF